MQEEARSKTLKQRIEDNAAILFAGIALSAFTAGWVSHGTFITSATPPAADDWQRAAEKNGWIAKNSCPAMPIELKILSPGNSATVTYSSLFQHLNTDTVVRSSRTLPKDDVVGLVFNIEGQANYYVDFPYFATNDARETFRNESTLKIPASLEGAKQLSLWAIVAEDKRELGSVYGSLDQIRSTSPGIFLSEKITVGIAPEK